MQAEQKTIQALEFVPSMHEQREFCNKVIPEEGWWVEVGKFTPIVETFDVKERYLCIERKELVDPIKNITRFVVTLKKIPLIEPTSLELADKIIEKHGELLAASLLKCVIKGARLNKGDISRFKNRVASGGDVKKFDELEDKSIKSELTEHYKKKIEATETRLNQYKKKLEEIERGVIPDEKTS
jgi:hypothetical protein